MARKRFMSSFCLLIVFATCLTTINLFVSVYTINMAEFSFSTTNWMDTVAGPPPPKTKKDTTNTEQPAIAAKEQQEQQQPLIDGLPKRLITIVGLENLGTVFMHMTLATALGLDKLNSKESWNSDGSLVLQHTSLPAGFRPDAQLEPMPILPVNVLFPCRLPKPPSGAWSDEKCNKIFGTGETDLRTVPRRHFINISSHINWYRSKSVDTTAIIAVRDAGIRIHGAFKYCHSDPVCYQQHLAGIGLIREAVVPEADVNHVLVSYETLMSVQKPYLFEIYKALEVNSTIMPQFKNGNMKYLLKDVPSKALRTELLHDVGEGVDMKF
jgi:hypothetical protein